MKIPVPGRVLALLLIPLVGALDYATGPELTVGLFYLAPVALLAWHSGRNAALGASALCALTWITVDFALGRVDANGVYYAWNFVSRFVPLVVISVLLSRLNEVLERERSHSRTDILTGAPNRRAVREIAEAELSRSLRYGRAVTLVYVDIDGFKAVNDTMGHAAGDRLLKAVVAAIRLTLRSSDVVGRIGGDEFVLLLPETASGVANATVTKILSHLREAMREGGWPVTFSMGAVTCHENPGFDALLTRADALMYSVKSAGKNGVGFADYAV